MFCHKCGAQINDGSVFCPKCGAKIVSADADQQLMDIPVPDDKSQQASGAKENTKKGKQASSNNTDKVSEKLRKVANFGRVLQYGLPVLLLIMSLFHIRINLIMSFIIVAGVAIGSIMSAFGQKSVPKKIFEASIGVFMLVIIVICLRAASGENDKYVQIVKSGTFDAYPQKTVGKAFDDFLDDPKWESGLSENNERIVNVKGGILYYDKEAELLVQFIVDEKTNRFQYNACEINDIPQNNIFFWGLLETIYNGGSISAESDSQGDSINILDEITIGETQSFDDEGFGNMEVTLDYAQFVDGFQNTWGDYQYPDEDFVFLYVAFTIKNIGTADSTMPTTWSEIVYDGTYEYGNYSTVGDFGPIPALSVSTEGAVIFMVPTAVMESDKSLVLNINDIYGQALMSYIIRIGDEVSDQSEEKIFSYDATAGFSRSLEYYGQLSGLYEGSMGQSSLGISIYSSQEEGEIAIGTVWMYVDDEQYYLGEIIAEPEPDVYLVETDAGEEVILDIYPNFGPIYIDLYVDGQYVDEYTMVEHYES